jgi:hypothetical protein
MRLGWGRSSRHKCSVVPANAGTHTAESIAQRV